MGILRRRTDPKIRWLASKPWWNELGNHELALLAATGDRTALPAGRWLMRQDQQGSEAAVEPVRRQFLAAAARHAG